jgi:hypothetical protein
MKGWKTKTGASIVALAALLGSIAAIYKPEWVPVFEAFAGVGAALAAWGLGHKIEKAAKVLPFFFLLALAGCSGMVRADAIKPSYDLVKERHDAYVIEDSRIPETVKKAHLRTSKLLKAIIDEAAK